MAREIEPAKPKFAHLKLLERLIEEKLGFTSSSAMNSTSHRLFVRDPLGGVPDSHDWFEREIPQASAVTHSMYKWGWTNNMKKPEWSNSDSRSGIFAWYEYPKVPTRQAVEYWNTTGKALLADYRAQEAATRAEVERYAIIGAKSPSTRAKADRRAGMLVRIVRETAKRFYVEQVDHADTTIGSYYFLEGNNRKGYYIERDQVWMDNVTRAEYDRLVAIEHTIVADKNDLRAKRDRDIKEIRDRFAERELQQRAEHDDRLKGL